MTPSCPEARDVGRADVLRVLDAPAQVLLVGMLLERLLVDVEHLAVAAVADRVDAQLVVVLDRELRRLPDVVQAVGVQAGRLEIRVRLQHPGAARTERAVDLPLDPAHGEPLVAVVDDAVFRHVDGQAIGRLAQHHPDAQRQLALVHHSLHQRDRVGPRPGVVHRRQALRERLARRQLDDLSSPALLFPPACAWRDRR